MRLQKFLAHAGVCSRRKAEVLIRAGQVKVNGRVVTQLGSKIDPVKDRVLFNQQHVVLATESPHTYIALNKPEGVVTSCAQQKTRIVLDLVDIDARVYPVGRLDKDSTGLILLTNDGDLHNRLSHPSFNHEKEYIVTTRHPISESALKKIAQGVRIENVKTRKAAVKRLGKNRFNIVLKQGRNRQIRKMVAKVGNAVQSLTRIRMANITLGSLKQGKWRYLTPTEIKQLTRA